jgi:putative endonuclease
MAMIYSVYVLRSQNHPRFYIGMTTNFERRLRQHNSGHTKSTRAYKPWVLVIIEEYDDAVTAREREKYLKSGVGREYIITQWTRSITE